MLARGLCEAYKSQPLFARVRTPSDFGTEGALAGGGDAMNLVLLIVLILLIVGALPTWSYSAGWGVAPAG
jgi:hypothetical protein